EPRKQTKESRQLKIDCNCGRCIFQSNGDRAGFDWSYMADDEVPTNMALIAFSDSEDSEINALNLQLEKLKKEKESNQIKIDNFENASKSLDKSIGSKITDNSRTGLGFTSYNVVAPPPIGLFAPPTVDLSNSSLKEFKQPEFEGYGPKASKSGKSMTNDVGKQETNVVKSSELWVWRPKIKLNGHLINDGYDDLVQHAGDYFNTDGQMATGKEFSNPLMAGSLPKTISAKSDDNRDFHQIVDFLTSCSITYALTEEDDKVERAITTDVRLEAAHASDNIFKTQTMEMPNVDIPQEMDTGGSLRRQDIMGEGHTSGSGEGRMKHPFKLTDSIPPTPYDSLSGGYTPGSDEGRLKLKELMVLCTTLANRVTTLENELLTTKAVYHKAFITLTKRVKKLETQLMRSLAKDKGKGIMQETELPKKLKKKEMIQLSLNEELAQRLYAE
nr:hypothetical protein [Tanacetum cinerariifolium]